MSSRHQQGGPVRGRVHSDRFRGGERTEPSESPSHSSFGPRPQCGSPIGPGARCWRSVAANVSHRWLRFERSAFGTAAGRGVPSAVQLVAWWRGDGLESLLGRPRPPLPASASLAQHRISPPRSHGGEGGGPGGRHGDARQPERLANITELSRPEARWRQRAGDTHGHGWSKLAGSEHAALPARLLGGLRPPLP
jgi:hypothetical protein